MEKEYVIEAYDRKFLVTFSHHLTQNTKLERITNCAILDSCGMKLYAGATIKNPHDVYNIHIARRYAFKRAVLFIFLVWSVQKRIKCDFNEFWQTFRKALAQNQLYLEDRRLGRYG